MTQLSQKSQEKMKKGDIAFVMNGYRLLAKQIEESSEEIILSQDPKLLTNYLSQNEGFFKSVKTPTVFAKDCETLRTITQTAVTQSSSVNLGPRPFTFNNVRNKMQQLFPSGDGFDWEALGEFALRRSKTAPTAQPFLFGLESFEVKKRERIQTQRARKDVIEAQQEVQNKDMSQAIANQLLQRAKRLHDKLKRTGDLPVTKVIASKSGFSQSVENAFELSHLIREGKVGLHHGNDGTVIATANVLGTQAGDRRKQCVLHLRDIDFKKIEQLIPN